MYVSDSGGGGGGGFSVTNSRDSQVYFYANNCAKRKVSKYTYVSVRLDITLYLSHLPISIEASVEGGLYLPYLALPCPTHAMLDSV